MKVKNIEIDLTDFDKSRQLTHYYFDIEVLHEYIDEFHYEIIVRRLDNEGKGGWKHDLFVLVNYISLEKTEKINTRCKLNSTIKLGTWVNVNVNVSSQIKL